MAETSTVTSNGNLLAQLAGELLRTAPPADEIGIAGAVDMPLDSSWVKQSFLVTTDQDDQPLLSKDAFYARRANTAMLKYTDSSIGGNTYINPLPQFTRYADIRRPGLNYRTVLSAEEDVADGVYDDFYVSVGMSRDPNYGQGEYWSEAFDDNAQIIHMRFGVPTFNSMLQFFTGFYDSGMATAARTARLSDSFVNRFLAGTGTVIGLAIAPLFIVPMAFTMIAHTARFLSNSPATKFYYLKPAMPIYWTAVTNIVNQIAVNAGLVNSIDTRQSASVMKGYSDPAFDGTGTIGQMGVIANYLPKDVLSSDGKTLDVKKIACRAKIMEMKWYSILSAAINNADPESSRFDETIRQALKSARGSLRSDLSSSNRGLEDMLTDHFKSQEMGRAASAPSTKDGLPEGLRPEPAGSSEMEFRANVARDKETNSITEDMRSRVEEIGKYFLANLADGSDWVSFRVDSTGPVQESFSNNTTASGIANTINSMSAKSRDIRFNLADGNLIPGMGAVIEGVQAIVGGIADIVNVDGIAALAGSAFVDIPEHWESSSANLPSQTYTTTLISPYGNPVSQLMHLWIPLAMLLAGALPLATGAQSHTSPFLCELYDRGRQMTRLGIVTNLSISRGTSHRGFNDQGHALAIEVSFTVKDLSTVMSMPVMPGFSPLHPFRGIADPDNAFTDYMLTLAGVQLADVIYRFPILKYQINKRISDYKSMLSPSNIGQSLASLPGVNLLSAATRGVSMP